MVPTFALALAFALGATLAFARGATETTIPAALALAFALASSAGIGRRCDGVIGEDVLGLLVALVLLAEALALSALERKAKKD